MAKIHAETEFEKYRIVQDRLYQSDFDRMMLNDSVLIDEATEAEATERK